MLSWKAEVRRDLTSRLSGSFAQQQQISLKSLFCQSMSDVSLYGLLFTEWSCRCGRVFYAMCRLTCLKEWVISLFPEVKKRFRITLMSWLSVWICSDLRTLVRGRGSAGKETWNRECSLFCLQFENQDLLPHQERKRRRISSYRCPRESDSDQKQEAFKPPVQLFSFDTNMESANINMMFELWESGSHKTVLA